MNTPLPVPPRSSHQSAILTAHQKSEQVQPNSQAKVGKTVSNLSLRYPKDLERCFILGNN